MRSLSIVCAGVVACALGWTALGEAQSRPLPEGAQSWSSMRVGANGGVLVRSSWSARNSSGRRTSDVQLSWLGADLAAQGTPVKVHQGDTVLVHTALRQDTALLTLLHGGTQPFVRVAIVRKGGVSARIVDMPRRVVAGYSPSYAVACATPEGFAILWQEASSDASGDVLAYFARVREEGSFLQQPATVAVPWGFGALQWNGRGYHLALYFDGSAYGQTRLNFVTLSALGAPEQHPWWVSRPEAVGEVQLANTQGGMMAVWRGGADETALHSLVFAGVGNWGTEPPAAQSLGRIDPGQLYALRTKADGSIEVVRK